MSKFTLIYLCCLMGLSQMILAQNSDLKACRDHSLQAVEAFKNVARSEIINQVFLGLNDSSRTRWSNLPLEQTARKGAMVKDLSDIERQHLHALLRNNLSPQGYAKVLLIMHYDDDTHGRLSQKNSPIAHRYGQGNYWFSVFGTPSETETWGWKFEGHHISLNFCYKNGKITATPLFLGVNPAIQTSGIRAGQAVMFEENNWGCQLFESLSDVQRQKAIAGTHPNNADVTADPSNGSGEGIGWSALTAQQKAWIKKGAFTWFDNMQPSIADAYKQDFEKNKKHFSFIWKGGYKTSELHYFAIKNGHTIIELTNRDGEIGHYHAFWRHLRTDFGQ